MKFRLISLSFILFIMVCCSPKQEEKNKKQTLIEKIQKEEKTVFDDNTNQYNHAAAIQVIKDYETYIEAYPKDSLSAEYLFMSAKLCKSINLFGEAVRKLQALPKQYPQFKQNPSALFMSAMILETNMKDTSKAKETYRLFIEKYPQHELTDDAQFLIDNLGKSDDELMEIIKAKQQ